MTFVAILVVTGCFAPFPNITMEDVQQLRDDISSLDQAEKAMIQKCKEISKNYPKSEAKSLIEELEIQLKKKNTEEAKKINLSKRLDMGVDFEWSKDKKDLKPQLKA